VRPLGALMRKEFASLFGSPTAYLTLTMVALVTALIFFDHLRIYNQVLFVYASTTMGGFDTGSIPDYINLWDTVFFPVMETLGLTLVGAVPLVTMRVFAEERARGTDELLVSTHLTPTAIVVGKFIVTFAFVVLMMAVSFLYPATAIEEGGIGLEHLGASSSASRCTASPSPPSAWRARPSRAASSWPRSRAGPSPSCSGTSAGRTPS